MRFQVSKRSLLRQLMGGAASSGDALAQVATTPLFPLNFLDISVVCCNVAASIHSSFVLAARCSSSEEPSRRRQEHAGDLVIGRSALSATAAVSGICNCKDGRNKLARVGG